MIWPETASTSVEAIRGYANDGVGGGEGFAGGPPTQDVHVEGHEAGAAAVTYRQETLAFDHAHPEARGNHQA
jgi:hypothetical protein